MHSNKNSPLGVNPRQEGPQSSLPMRALGRTGIEISELGLGGGPFGNLFQRVSDAEVSDTISASHEAGIRYFDTAPFYGFGLSERRVGDALRVFDRNSFVLSTKAGRILEPLLAGKAGRAPSVFESDMPFDARFDYSYDGVMRSHEASLHRLGLARIDILLFHDIAGDAHDEEQLSAHMKVAFEGGMKAATELKNSGAVRAIGLGVNRVEACMAALELADLDCLLLASRYTLLDNEKALPVLEASRRKDIGLIIGAPFNSGILVHGSSAATTFEHAPASATIVNKVKDIERICRAHSVPLPAAALQFPLRNKAVDCVLPGLRSRSEVIQAVKWASQPIDTSFWDDLRVAGLLVEN